MLQAMDLLSATNHIVTPPSKPALGMIAQAAGSSIDCELSNRFGLNRFGLISAGIQSGQAAEGKTAKKIVTATEPLEGCAPKAEEAWRTTPKTEKSLLNSAIAAQPALAQVGSYSGLQSPWKFFGESVNQDLKVDEVIEKLESGKLWVVNSRRRNGLIVLREFHAEFAGPGAAVGGDLDSEDIVGVIPIGNLSLLSPTSHEAHQNAIKIRLQWIRLTQNFTDQPRPDDRARMILEQFKTYFDQATVDLVPDQAFALLVGVLPRTIRRVRSGFVW